MKYCTKCRRLYNDEDTECKECKKGKLETITDESTPVYLCSGDIMERDRVQAVLKDSKIPSDYKRNMVSANSQVVTGIDFDVFDILVPFDMYEQAFDVAVGIGAIKLNEEETLAYKLDKNDGIEEFEEMSSSKRTTVRIISAILIIIAFAAIIYGVDFIMALIKNLFT